MDGHAKYALKNAQRMQLEISRNLSKFPQVSHDHENHSYQSHFVFSSRIPLQFFHAFIPFRCGQRYVRTSGNTVKQYVGGRQYRRYNITRCLGMSPTSVSYLMLGTFQGLKPELVFLFGKKRRRNICAKSALNDSILLLTQ